MNGSDFCSRETPLIIAEAGTCHAGPVAERLPKALRYVSAAARAGAGAIKFQMFSGQPIFCQVAGDEERRVRWDASVMSFVEWQQVKAFAEHKGLMFLASVFDHEAIEILHELDVVATKVASRAAKNFPYFDSVAPTPYLISTGINYLNKVSDGIYFECESNYPSTSRYRGDFPGFSDHSGTPLLAIDALLKGAKYIEVHFYIDDADAGPDYPASLTLDQLKIVCDMRNDVRRLFDRS
jgi:N,N'-diacetyllegionaminate synthase